MNNYYYLDVSLQFAYSYNNDITAAFFKKNIVESVKQLFGEVAAAVDIDLLKYDSHNRRAILRVPKTHYVKIRSSLTLCCKYEGVLCAYKINKLKMSHCRKLGPNNKDIVIFATKEDHQIPSKIVLPEAEPQPGLILPNGDINWNCPCLGGMATGPCGVEFRNAFSCFHYSEADPKGSDCYDLFKDMQGCMQKYPTLYNKDLADDDELSSMDQAAKDPASKQDQTETSNTTPNK